MELGSSLSSRRWLFICPFFPLFWHFCWVTFFCIPSEPHSWLHDRTSFVRQLRGVYTCIAGLSRGPFSIRSHPHVWLKTVWTCVSFPPSGPWCHCCHVFYFFMCYEPHNTRVSLFLLETGSYPLSCIDLPSYICSALRPLSIFATFLVGCVRLERIEYCWVSCILYVF